MGLVGKAGLVKRPKQPVSRAIARENAARAIGSMRGGRQAYDHDPGLGVAKTVNGFAPVGLAGVRPLLFLRHMQAILSQPWARFTVSDFGVKVS